MELPIDNNNVIEGNRTSSNHSVRVLTICLNPISLLKYLADAKRSSKIS